MNVRVATSVRIGAEMLCGFVFAGAKAPEFGIKDKNTARVIEQSAADMAGKAGRIAVIPTASREPASRILLAGLGRPADVTSDLIRHVSGRMAKKAKELNLAEFFVLLPAGVPSLPWSVSASAVAEGAVMSMYRFNKFKSADDETGNAAGAASGLVADGVVNVRKRSAKSAAEPSLAIVMEDGLTLKKDVADAVRTAVAVSEGNTFVRSVANLPPNECTPATLAGVAQEIAKSNTNLKCMVVSKRDLKRRGFGGITAVGQGSKNEPKLIILEYKGRRKAAAISRQRPIVLVGKAVTFDTGGISLKPGANMDEMKFDKCGGCTVLGILRTAAAMRLNVDIVGIVPAVENMPGGESYRPGDIIRLYSGKTAEIINTDAEGRLILADALAYGEQHYKPSAIIDFATLTGACIIALGNNVAGMVSNDAKLADRMRDSSGRTAEAVWELPLNRDYMDMIKSSVADMRNLGIGRAAGTITAAAFLQNAVENTPWVHFDIAGVAWTQTATKERSYKSKGATGFGVRLIMDYLLGLANESDPRRK